MNPENLVKAVKILDNHIPKELDDPNSIAQAAEKLELKNFSQSELVNGFNLFFAQRFEDRLQIFNRITPPVIGDLMALVTEKLGLAKQEIFDPEIVFPDLIFQFASHFGQSIYGRAADSIIDASLKKLANIYRFDFTDSDHEKIVVSRILGIDFAAEMNHFFKASNLKVGESAILLVNNSDLQSNSFAEILKKNKNMALLAIIELPTKLFKHSEMRSSLLILRRKVDNEKVTAQVLLAQIPELSNKEDFSKFVSQLETWKKENL
ncbi:putative Adenine-specific DNA methylase [Oenococcus oeni]|uniref:DNA methyltransferase n=1 Tax=Oenococcus oeni TaxID=1247 RepID=UPI00107D75C5|nr:DNA methyltransferase [Oenococcus oeni]AVI94434.1 DNA methyltransferase [Oenococcus oeni]SYW02597.1 putative Adenine-specific DNA methylase [Oenococcus oeni]SYW02801.1 putative Adenine-specific DNA methylase [Oenococcus oeni]SYW19154.1 putative Adenine-specific DNA methylase [Oenococcus oeni]VDC15001.1 putative Adenine-specific DNA methylase [Oenococcus oeni]